MDNFSLAWLNILFIICTVLMKEISCSATTCAQGYEYQCQWVTNSTGCINGCNTTVTEILAPGSCNGSCCKMCFQDCFVCVYVKVFVIEITNKKWTNKFTDKKSEAFKTFEQDLHKAITYHLARHDIQSYGLTLLRVKESDDDTGVIVYMMLTSSNTWNEDKSLNFLKVAADNGHLGEFRTQPNTFKVMEESEYRYKTEHKRTLRPDIIETIVTSIAAGVIVCAIAGILYLYCTTPSQRCATCRRRNRIN